MITIEEINERNSLVSPFFLRLGYNVVAYGDINSPAIILDNKTILSCYVKNFKIIFTDQPRAGEELFKMHLKTEKFTEEFIGEFIDWMQNVEHRECYMVGVVNTNLRLSGYNFKVIKGSPDDRYPVFSEFNYKIYFNKEYAEELIETYQSETLQLELV